MRRDAKKKQEDNPRTKPPNPEKPDPNQNKLWRPQKSVAQGAERGRQGDSPQKKHPKPRKTKNPNQTQTSKERLPKKAKQRLQQNIAKRAERGNEEDWGSDGWRCRVEESEIEEEREAMQG